MLLSICIFTNACCQLECSRKSMETFRESVPPAHNRRPPAHKSLAPTHNRRRPAHKS